MSAISLSRWRVNRRMTLTFSALILALVFTLSTGSLAFAAEKLVRISTDTFTNSDSQHQTEVEPDTFAFGKTIVSVFQVGRFFNGGASDIGFATSTNGGETWVHGTLPDATVNSTPANPTYARASDASVAFDARHNVWITSWLGLFPNGNGAEVDVLVSRSTDGGLTWGSPVVVNASGDFNDKNWSVCDDTKTSPHYGNCYTEFDDASLGDLEQMSTSTDGGLTWGTAHATADGSHGIGGQPLVQPNGNVIVPYVGLDSAVFAFTISSFMSTNGGASWSASTLVSEADFHDPNPSPFAQPSIGIRADIPLPTAEVDKSGKVYVVWSDCRFESSCAASDLVLSTSTNGTAWTPVARIPIDPVNSGFDHFIPGLAVDRSTSGKHAHLALAFYFYPQTNCTIDACQLKVGFVSSTDGGAHWSAKEQLTGAMKLTWLADTTQGRMVGDYISTSIVPGDDDATPVFAVAEPPTGAAACGLAPAVCNEAMFTTAEDLMRIVGGPNAAGSAGAHLATRTTRTRSSSPPTAY